MSRRFTSLLLIVAGASALGCVTPKGGGIASLSYEEQNMFFRCTDEVVESECTETMGDQVAKTICQNELQERFAGARDKRRWLLQHGCLPETVDGRPR